MWLFRLIFAPTLAAVALPCAAQSLSANQPPASVKSPVKSFFCTSIGDHKSPALEEKLCSEAQKYSAAALQNYLAEKNSACYSIRDYRFAAPQDTAVPTLKGYSTCERASSFEKRDIAPPER